MFNQKGVLEKTWRPINQCDIGGVDGGVDEGLECTIRSRLAFGGKSITIKIGNGKMLEFLLLSPSCR